jgi:hypothetical protein
LNTVSPAAASCARLVPVEAARAMPAITHFFIFFLLAFFLRFGLHFILTMSPTVRMAFRAFSGKVESGFPSENATNARLLPPAVSTAEGGYSFRPPSARFF